MKIALDNSFDSHWAYVNQFQKTTFNLILKSRINASISQATLLNTIKCLQHKHPYLTGKLTKEINNEQETELYLSVQKSAPIIHSINPRSKKELDDTMGSLSPHLRKRLNLEKGELININLYVTENESIIEFVSAHLIGDATALLLLMKDFFRYLDQNIENKNFTNTSEKQQERLMFDETRYKWTSEKAIIQALPLPEDTAAPNDWPQPKLDYKRFSLELEQFKSIEKKLKEKNIKATANDFFYYITANIFSEYSKYNPVFSTVQSFRGLLQKKKKKTNINTSAIFKPVNIDDDLLKTPKEWLEAFYIQRKNGLNTEEILGLINFLRSLNTSLSHSNLEQGKTTLFNLMPISAFAFNNLGKTDDYLSGLSNFNITDIDYQGGTPGEVIRMLGFKDRIYFSPIFYADSPLKCDEFWILFTEKIETLLEKL